MVWGLLLTVMAILALYGIHYRDRQRIRNQRAALFEDCAPLFDGVRLQQQGVGYPALAGTYQGRRFRLELLYEALTYRKLPVLWLSATLLEPTGCKGVLDLLARPQNTEYFSPFWDLPVSCELPAGSPAHAMLRCDDPTVLPPQACLAPHLDFFADAGAKELLVTSQGVRLVQMVAQAERSRYQVLRHGHFEQPQLSAAQVQPVLERLLALHASLEAAPGAVRIPAIAA